MKRKKESHISSICTMKMTWNKKAAAALAVCALFGLAGCGGSKGSSADYAATETSFAVNDEAKNAYAEEEAAEYDTSGAGNGAQYGEYETEQPVNTEKLVYRGSLSIQTREYDKSAAALREKVNAFGGFIENENEYSQGGYYTGKEQKSLWVLYMNVRIPTERFEEFLGGAEDIGNITSRSSSAENISRVYNDVSAQIEALEKQQKRLLEMMDRAETIEDMIAVEDRLSEVQYQLNKLKTNRESMDTDVAYSTVSITLNEVRVYTETSENFFDRLGSRFVNGFSGFAEVCEGLILGLVYLLPYILVGALIIFGLIKGGVFGKIHFPRFRKKHTDNE